MIRKDMAKQVPYCINFPLAARSSLHGSRASCIPKACYQPTCKSMLDWPDLLMYFRCSVVHTFLPQLTHVPVRRTVRLLRSVWIVQTPPSLKVWVYAYARRLGWCLQRVLFEGAMFQILQYLDHGLRVRITRRVTLYWIPTPPSLLHFAHPAIIQHVRQDHIPQSVESKQAGHA